MDLRTLLDTVHDFGTRPSSTWGPDKSGETVIFLPEELRFAPEIAINKMRYAAGLCKPEDLAHVAAGRADFSGPFAETIPPVLPYRKECSNCGTPLRSSHDHAETSVCYECLLQTYVVVPPEERHIGHGWSRTNGADTWLMGLSGKIGTRPAGKSRLHYIWTPETCPGGNRHQGMEVEFLADGRPAEIILTTVGDNNRRSKLVFDLLMADVVLLVAQAATVDERAMDNWVGTSAHIAIDADNATLPADHRRALELAAAKLPPFVMASAS